MSWSVAAGKKEQCLFFHSLWYKGSSSVSTSLLDWHRRCRIQFPGALIASASVSTVAETQNHTGTDNKTRRELVWSWAKCLWSAARGRPGLALVGLVWFGCGHPFDVRMWWPHCFHMMLLGDTARVHPNSHCRLCGEHSDVIILQKMSSI